MSNDIVTAYWIEADTGEFVSKNMGSADVFRGGTYESEVILKHARNPLEIVIVPSSQRGNDWARSEIKRLKDKSATMQRQFDSKPASD